MELLSNAPKLKDVELKEWLDEDYSPKVQLEHKKLRDFAKSNRTDEERYKVRYNKPELNGCIYRYDAANQHIVKVTSHQESTVRLTDEEQTTVQGVVNQESAQSSDWR